MKLSFYIIIFIFLTGSCSSEFDRDDDDGSTLTLEFGGDFSIMKKMEDSGGLYKIDGFVKEGMEIFSENGFQWAKLRLFHTPNMIGPVCNDLDYTIKLAQNAKKYGLKVLLNIHYSDNLADPGHQTVPKAWLNLSFKQVEDSVYNYTKNVIEAMDFSGVAPDMVQIGNEINNGFLWPHGKLWIEPQITHWDELAQLLKAGIRGVKEARNGFKIPIVIHAAKGGDVNSSYKFYKNIVERGVDFDVIGLSYYPWWHGTFIELESNILFLSTKFSHELSIVETAYYSNSWYPELAQWNSSDRPFPPTEQGQYNFMFELAQIMKRNQGVKTMFYSKPDGLEIPKIKIDYLGTSLFDKDGDAFIGISAWKDASRY
jgi:arabinogalactan endo-1,4-beta-galactosidase